MDEANNGVPPEVGAATLEEKVLALRNQGCRNHEIADKLQIPYAKVSYIAHRLIASGRIQPITNFWRDLSNERTQLIIAMAKDKTTLEQIGETLGGFTREYARVVIKRMKRVHGEEIFKPERQTLTPTNAAHILHTTLSVFKNLCEQAGIPLIKRGRRTCLIDLADVEKLRFLLEGQRTRKCVVCKQAFSTFTRRTICDQNRCRRERNRLRRFVVASIDSLTNWRRDLLLKLKGHRIPDNEKWLTEGEACQLTGLHRQRLIYLRSRKLLQTRRHPSRRWKGNQMIALFARSELQILKRVYDTWCRKQKRRKKKSP